MDRSGITIEDGVFIAPKVNLTTLNHDFNPEIEVELMQSQYILKKMHGLE